MKREGVPTVFVRTFLREWATCRQTLALPQALRASVEDLRLVVAAVDAIKRDRRHGGRRK